MSVDSQNIIDRFWKDLMVTLNKAFLWKSPLSVSTVCVVQAIAIPIYEKNCSFSLDSPIETLAFE